VVRATCQTCDREFWGLTNHGYPRRFCSAECAHNRSRSKADIVCAKCGKWTEFKDRARSSAAQSGKADCCQECYLTARRAYYRKNAERILANNRPLNRRWSQANREYERERRRRYCQENPEKVSEYQKRNRVKINARRRKHRENDPAYPTENRASQARRRQKPDGGKVFTAAEFRALCEKTGNRCLCCGATDVRLTADHVLPLSRGGSNGIENIQPLCGSCNSAKGAKHIDYR
jgi:hypothetical protein